MGKRVSNSPTIITITKYENTISEEWAQLGKVHLPPIGVDTPCYTLFLHWWDMWGFYNNVKWRKSVKIRDEGSCIPMGIHKSFSYQKISPMPLVYLGRLDTSVEFGIHKVTIILLVDMRGNLSRHI